MNINEFTERTGFTPTWDEYRAIEDQYMEFNGDKDAFCKAWATAGGEVKVYADRVTRIQELEGELIELKKIIAKKDKTIDTMERQLEREMEWKPAAGTGTNMKQADYEKLRAACAPGHGDPRELTEGEAEKLIHEEFGFDTAMVMIVGRVASFEVNRHRTLRKAEEYERIPCYNATDWNYIRFNCGAFMWEMVNGDLLPYCT